MNLRIREGELVAIMGEETSDDLVGLFRQFLDSDRPADFEA